MHGVEKVWGKGSQKWNQRAVALQRVMEEFERSLERYTVCFMSYQDAWPVDGSFLEA